MSEATYNKKIASGDGIRIQQDSGKDGMAIVRKRSGQEKFLLLAVLILLIVLIVAIIVFIALYALEVTKDKQGEQLQETPSRIKPVCFSHGCVFSASGQFMFSCLIAGCLDPGLDQATACPSIS